MASKTRKFNTKAIPDSPGQFHTVSKHFWICGSMKMLFIAEIQRA